MAALPQMNAGTATFAYELKIISYLSLRFSDLDNGIKNFEIFHNIKEYGKFNDVIIELTKETGEALKFIMQLKHFSKGGKEREKTLKNINFEKIPNFKLQAYWESIKYCEKTGNSTVKYVIFTNKDMDETEPNFIILNEPDIEPNFIPNINDSDVEIVQIEGHAFRIKYYTFQTTNAAEENNSSRFLREDFVVLSNQPHQEDLDNIMTNLIQRMFGLDDSTSRDVVLKFVKFVDNWKHGYCGGHIALTKEVVQFKLIELITASHFIPFHISSTNTEKGIKEYQKWKELIRQKKLVIVANVRTAIQFKAATSFVYCYIKATLAEYITISDWNSVVSLDEFKKFSSKIPNAKKEMEVLWGNNLANTITYQQVYFYLWKKNLVPLALSSNEENLRNISPVLNFEHNQCIVFCDSGFTITADMIESLEVGDKGSVLQSLTDLEPNNQQWILEQPMEFQGRIMKVEDVFYDDQLSRKLFAVDIIEIIQNSFKIGDNLGELPNIFIERSLNSIFVTPEIFSKGTKYIIFETDRTVIDGYIQQMNVDKALFTFISRVDFSFSTEYEIFFNQFLSEREVRQLISEENSNVKYIFLKLNDRLETIPFYSEYVQKINVLLCKNDELLWTYFKKNNVPCKSHQVCHISEINLNNVPLTCQYIISSENADVSALKNMGNRFLIYFFRLHHSKRSFFMEFLGSFGNSSKIRKFTDTKATPANKYVMEHCFKYNNLNIITGSPGMGKTVLINYLSEKCPPPYLVILIKSNQYNEYLNSMNLNEFDISSTLDYFISKNIRDFDDCFVTKYINEKKILLCFDGFDEIMPESEIKTISFFKMLLNYGITLFITTRNVKVEALESEFKSVSRALLPFNETDQGNYLSKYFNARVSQIVNVDDFVAKLLSTTKKQMSVWDTEFSGIPLQTFMIAEVYLEQCQKYCNKNNTYDSFDLNKIDSLILYDKFVNMKINIWKARAGNGPHIESFIIDYYLRNHKYLAMKYIFSIDCPNMDFRNILEHKKAIIAFGVIDQFSIDEKPMFVHRTFAEYLAALHISENFNDSCIRELFNMILQNSVYNIIRQTVDRLLSKDCPLHRALLNNNVPKFNALLNESNELSKVDKGGRNILHIAMSYGTRHKIPRMGNIDNFGNVESTYDFEQKLNDICSKCKERVEYVFFVEFILSKGVNLMFQTDEILNSSPLEYGFKALTLENVNLYLQALLKANICITKIRSIFEKFCRYDQSNFSLFSSNATTKCLINTFYYKELLFVATLYNYKYLASSVFDLNTSSSKIYKVKFTHYNFHLLHFAAMRNSDDIIKLLIKHGVNINATDKLWGKSALHFAAEFGNVSTVNLLLSKNATVSLKDKDKITAYTYALLNNHDIISEILFEIVSVRNEFFWDPVLKNAKFVENMLERGVNFQLIDRNDQTAVAWALKSNLKETLAMFMDTEIQTGKRVFDNSDLINAAHAGNVELVAYLLNSGRNPNIKCIRTNDTPLIIFSKEGNFKMVKLLIRNGADVNQTGHLKMTPILWSSIKGHADVLKLLLTRGANIHIVDNSRYTALTYAIINNKEEIIEIFLNEIRNGGSFLTPIDLIVASEKGNLEVVSFLLNFGIDPNEKSQSNTPLLLASFHGHFRIVQLLIEKGANVNHVNDNKETALMLASKNGHLQTVTFLINKGANLYSIDKDRYTAVTHALFYNRKEIVAMFLEKEQTDKQIIFTPFDLIMASEKGYVEVVKHLLKSGINSNVRDNGNNSPLIFAASAGHLEIVKLLIEGGADINHVNNKKQTALINVSIRGHTDIVNHLLKEGAKVNVVDWQNCTALKWAKIYNNVEVIQLLRRNGARK